MNPKPTESRILIIDDDELVCSSLLLLLKQNGHPCLAATDPAHALDLIHKHSFDLVLQDMNFSRNTSGEEGLWLLEKIRAEKADVPIILITAWATIELAVAGIKLGANDFVAKPWDNQHLIRTIETNLKLSRTKPVLADRIALDAQYKFSSIIGEDPSIVSVLSMVARVAHTDASVLILGETGTGKELIADAIHNNSRRADQSLIKVNLGGTPAALFESEMFGHVRGAFTDAHRDRIGRFAQADGGTLFMDEIGDLDQTSQAKLLRVLQDQQYHALGDSSLRRADVRVVSATSRPLNEMVAEGRFREDLLYRLNLITVELPALRNRRSDIPLLASSFLQQIQDQYEMAPRTLADSALQWLKSQPWPGNIRQLRQSIERATLMSDLAVLTHRELIQSGAEGSADQHSGVGLHPISQGMTLDQAQATMIRSSLEKHGGNISRSANELGLSRAALYRRMEKYEIDQPVGRAESIQDNV